MVLAGWAAVAGQAEVGQMANPGFEADADRDGIPDGWQRAGSAVPEVVALDSEVKKEGRASLRLESRSRPTDNHFCQTVGLEPGAIYRVSAWVKTKDYKAVEGAPVRATISVRTHFNGGLIECGRPREGTTEWEEETLDFAAPGNGKAVIACEYASWGRATGTVWFDGFRLERVAGPGQFEALAEAPHGCHLRAEWAARRVPRDWATLAGALDSFYSQGGSRERGRVADHLAALTAAAQADPKAHAALRDLYAKHAWRIALSELGGTHVWPLLEEAAVQLAQDPKKADLLRSARLGIARFTALHGNEAVPAAVKALSEAAGGDQKARQEIINVLLGDIKHLQAKGPQAQAKRICAILLVFVPAEAPERASVESANLDFLKATGDFEAARAAAERLLAADSKATPPLKRQALLTLAELCSAVDEKDKAQQWLARADQEYSTNRGARAGFRLDFAKALAKQERWGEVTAACLTIVASFPQEVKACFEAQQLLVKAAMQQRRYEDALGAARVLYGVAPNSEKEITDAVNLVMQALRARYRSIALANDFAAFQSYGPEGKDGRKGTEDDIINPLANVRWSPPAEVEALFKKTLASLPEDFQGRRWRGYLYLYWDKPDLALKEFVKRYDEAPLEQKAVDEAIGDLVVALKAHCGHTLAGERFMKYQKFGPKGEDGKLGTDDDLTDPLKDLLGK